jgi:hypothetical protein
MSITLTEILEFGARWFDTTAGGSAAQQEAFFIAPHARIFVMQSGASLTMAEHETLHAQWVRERHEFGDFTLTELGGSPERVRAVGTVYWEAEYRDRPAPNVIKAVVGEDWIIERGRDGALRFVLYMNTCHHLLPGSAPIGL